MDKVVSEEEINAWRGNMLSLSREDLYRLRDSHEALRAEVKRLEAKCKEYSRIEHLNAIK